MKKSLFIKILFLLIFTGGTSFNGLVNNVYICKGKYSEKYHYISNCRGLSNCKSSIKEVTQSEAENYGRTLCGWED